MPNPGNEYVCPRCHYTTTLRSRIKQHFETLKKVCPGKTPIELTTEIKEYVMKNYIYVKPLQKQEGSDNSSNKIDNPRKNIPAPLKQKIWLKYLGNSLEGKCFCCEHNIISPFDFHCGHVKAHSEGGSISLENLRPICRSCNLSMGTENLLEFKSRLTDCQSN